MPTQTYRVIMLGPQGAGKGTQAEILAKRLGVPTVSTGVLYRDHIAMATPLGIEANRYLSVGRLAPNALTNRMMEERMKHNDVKGGWIIDGYPRNMNQLEALLSFETPTHVILVDLSDDEAMRRLEGRRSCLVCKKGYHIEFVPPKVPDVCDECGGQLVQREDDKPEAIKKRLEIYHAETEPMLGKFEEMGLLHRVDGSKAIEQVAEEVASILGL